MLSVGLGRVARGPLAALACLAGVLLPVAHASADAGAITGTVTAASSARAVAAGDVFVEVYTASGAGVTSVQTGAYGTYSIAGLDPGS
jgi:hypothetical protein